MHNTRLRYGLGAAVLLILGALAIAILVGAVTNAPTLETASGEEFTDGPSSPPGRGPTKPPRDAVLVHVGGAVTSPGVYSLPVGARVLDAVTAASGLAADADRDAVNLARLIEDGEQLYVPRLGESAPSQAGQAHTSQKVNLNRADAAELDSLPRVGPALAQRIIDYREANGPFTSIDGLNAVSGIGESTFAQLHDLVTV